MSKYQQGYVHRWRQKKAWERIEKRYEEYIKRYEKAKIQSNLNRNIQLAYVAGIIDGEGSICQSLQKKHVFVSSIYISNNDEKMLRFCKDVLKFGGIYEHKVSKSRPKKSWRYSLWRREHIVQVLIEIRPYLITKQKQADLLFEYCSRRLETRQPYTQRDYEIYRELKLLNARGKNIGYRV